MKTRLYTRKRALISSVAMLLVAMIALGTATFAWFTSSKTATASNIKVGTTKQSNLVISKLDKAWSTSVDYGLTDQKTFIPVSSADLQKWYTAEAAVGDNYARKTGVDAKDVTTKVINAKKPVTNASYVGENYAFVNQLNVKNAGAEKIENVKIKFTLNESATTEGYNYLRFAIVDVTDEVAAQTGTTVGVNAELPVPDMTKATIYATEDGKSWKPLNGLKTEAETPLTALNASSQIQYPSTQLDLEPSQAKYYNIYFWFEGQDDECTTVNSGNYLPDIEFTVVPVKKTTP